MPGLSDNIMTDFEDPLEGKRIVVLKIKLRSFYLFQSQTAVFQHYQMNGLPNKIFCTEIMIDVIEAGVNVRIAVVV